MKGEPFSFSTCGVTTGVPSVLVGFTLGALVVGSPFWLAVVVPPWFVTVVEIGWSLFTLMGSSPGVVLPDWSLEEGCSVGSPPFEDVPSAELFLGFAPLTTVEFLASPSVVVLFPLPVDLGCKLLRLSHPAAPPLMMSRRWTILIS